MIGSSCSFPNYQRERHAYYIGMQFFANKIIKRYGNEHIINFAWTVTHRTQGEALHFHTRLAHDEHLGDDDDDDTKTSHTVPATLLSDFHTKTHTHTTAVARLLTAHQVAVGHHEGLHAERTEEEEGLVLPSLVDGVGGKAGDPGELYRNRVISVWFLCFLCFYAVQYRSFFHFLL